MPPEHGDDRWAAAESLRGSLGELSILLKGAEVDVNEAAQLIGAAFGFCLQHPLDCFPRESELCNKLHEMYTRVQGAEPRRAPAALDALVEVDDLDVYVEVDDLQVSLPQAIGWLPYLVSGPDANHARAVRIVQAVSRYCLKRRTLCSEALSDFVELLIETIDRVKDGRSMRWGAERPGEREGVADASDRVAPDDAGRGPGVHVPRQRPPSE